MEFPTALGGERSFLAAASHLRQAFDLAVIAPAGGSLANELHAAELPHLPLEFRSADSTRRSDDDLVRSLSTLLGQFDADLLHTNSLTLGRFVGRNRKSLPLPITGHIRDIMRLSGKAISDLNRLDHLIAVSQATAKAICEQGVAEQKLTVLHNGVDTQEFQQPPAFDLRAELHLPADCKLAVTIGQIGLRKGHDLLFDSLSQLARQHPDWHYLILGERFSEKAESRAFVAALEAKARSGGFEQNLHWMGYVNEVPSVLAQSDLLIHPARQEPFGRVLLEAAAAGVAILASDAGGTPEMLHHQESAWLVPAGSLDDLTDGCRRQMDDDALRSRLAVQAQREITERFPAEKAATGLAEIWRQTLATTQLQ